MPKPRTKPRKSIPTFRSEDEEREDEGERVRRLYGLAEERHPSVQKHVVQRR